MWGGWRSPAAVYEDALTAVRGVSEKPLVISEYGCSSMVDGKSDVARKGRWIREAFDYFEQRDVRMALWLNREKETDWAVFGGSAGTETFVHEGTRYTAYREYRTALDADWVLPAYPGHPRRLTTPEFQGGVDVSAE